MNIRTSIGESKYIKSKSDSLVGISSLDHTFNINATFKKYNILYKLDNISRVSTNLDIDEIFNWLYADKSLSRFSDYINHFNDIHHTRDHWKKSAKCRYHRKMCIYD